MRIANRMSAIILAAALILTLCVNSARAGKPETIPAWFNDDVVYIIPGVSKNVVGVDHPAIADHVANPLYVVGDQQVSHILGVAIPGAAGYNPYWELVFVTVNSNRNLTTDPFTSEEDILDAEASGEVTLDYSPIILLCQVVSK